jgi:hypothetical protein
LHAAGIGPAPRRSGPGRAWTDEGTARQVRGLKHRADAYAQLWLARTLAADIRMPWQQPCPPGRLTPARVRRGFRRIRQNLPVPASAPKPSRPGPGRPPGAKNRRPATRHDVGKTVKRTDAKAKNPQADRLNNKLSCSRPPGVSRIGST